MCAHTTSSDSQTSRPYHDGNCVLLSFSLTHTLLPPLFYPWSPIWIAFSSTLSSPPPACPTPIPFRARLWRCNLRKTLHGLTPIPSHVIYDATTWRSATDTKLAHILPRRPNTRLPVPTFHFELLHRMGHVRELSAIIIT